MRPTKGLCIILCLFISIFVLSAALEAGSNDSWLFGNWNVSFGRENLEGFLGIGVHYQTGRVFSIFGNWGPAPRGQFFRPEIDEEVSATYIETTQNALDFDFVCQQMIRVIGPSGVPILQKVVVRSGRIFVERMDRRTLQGTVRFAGEEPQGIIFYR